MATPPDLSYFGGKRVLVTGHTGFKGAWLSLWLVRLGAEVTGLSLPPEHETDNLSVILGLDREIRSVHCDLRDREATAKVVAEAQPQVVLQMIAHLLQAGSSPGWAMTAPRFTLTVPDAVGFDTWDRPDELVVAVEAGSGWVDGLAALGHRVDERPWGQGTFGHAHLIEVDGVLSGVADPRALTGAAVGL